MSNTQPLPHTSSQPRPNGVQDPPHGHIGTDEGPPSKRRRSSISSGTSGDTPPSKQLCTAAPATTEDTRANSPQPEPSTHPANGTQSAAGTRPATSAAVVSRASQQRQTMMEKIRKNGTPQAIKCERCALRETECILFESTSSRCLRCIQAGSKCNLTGDKRRTSQQSAAGGEETTAMRPDGRRNSSSASSCIMLQHPGQNNTVAEEDGAETWASGAEQTEHVSRAYTIRPTPQNLLAAYGSHSSLYSTAPAPNPPTHIPGRTRILSRETAADSPPPPPSPCTVLDPEALFPEYEEVGWQRECDVLTQIGEVHAQALAAHEAALQKLRELGTTQAHATQAVAAANSRVHTAHESGLARVNDLVNKQTSIITAFNKQIRELQKDVHALNTRELAARREKVEAAKREKTVADENRQLQSRIEELERQRNADRERYDALHQKVQLMAADLYFNGKRETSETEADVGRG